MTCYRVRIEQFVSSCIHIHGYNPPYLTIDIIYDVSLSQLQTKGVGEEVVSLIYCIMRLSVNVEFVRSVGL